MKREYFSDHSAILDRDMSMLVFGDAGYPVIAFQVEDAKSNNFEDFGMIEVLSEYIESGKIQVFSVDNADEESWMGSGDLGYRAQKQEDYFRYVTDELLPLVQKRNGSKLRPLVVGCSLGATHAAIAAFRRPDLFEGCIGLSGLYRTNRFFGEWMDGTLYENDVPAFLSGMPTDHPYVELYNKRQLVLCTGQGAWEAGLDDVRAIDDQLRRLGVDHWCDYWGEDVSHDWPWWRKQIAYFMPFVLEDIAKKQAEEAAAAPKKAAAKKAPAKKPTTRKTAAKKTTAAKSTATKAAAASKTAATKTAASKATTTKAAASKTATASKSTAAKTTAAKAPAAKTTAAKPAAKAAASKASAAKTATAEKAVSTKAAASKTTAAKTTATKTSATKTSATAKNTAVKATSAKAATPKATATKPATTKVTATKTATAKATATKTTASKTAAAKPSTTTKSTAAKITSAKTTVSKTAAAKTTAAAKKATSTRSTAK